MIDPAFKRQQFLALKERADNGQLIPPPRKKFTPKVRKAVWEAYDGLCARCEEPLGKVFEIDHILERDLMGSDDLPNLVPLHPECHRPKTSARAPVLGRTICPTSCRFTRNVTAPRPPRGRRCWRRLTGWLRPRSGI